jgi:DNA-binding NtrC family response regulator
MPFGIFPLGSVKTPGKRADFPKFENKFVSREKTPESAHARRPTVSTILVADDEEIIREELAEVLGEQGYRVLTAPDGAAALQELRDQSVQVVITDLRMPKVDGLELIRKGKETSPETQFVMMTAFGSMETAIEALRAGASDYLLKPVAMEELIPKIGRIVENAELKSANRMLTRDLERKLGTLEMIGQSTALEKIRQLIKKVGPTKSTVLITGESGTGKELIARAIHSLGAQKGEPFVPVNCAAIPEQLLESELFGHQKGAYTGAISDAEGLFRAARKGTLFLDEIGELPLSLQAKLLRILEEKMIQPVGASRQVPFEARVVAATNLNLKQEIAKKTFREDLYFRLAVVEIYAPALRERQEDIPLLINHFVRKLNRELKRTYTGVEDKALQRMIASPWKGNIRELQNTIERAMIVGTEPMVRDTDLTPTTGSDLGPSLETRELKSAVDLFEKSHIKHILGQCGGDKRKAARELGISLSSLYRRLDEKPVMEEAHTSE